MWLAHGFGATGRNYPWFSSLHGLPTRGCFALSTYVRNSQVYYYYYYFFLSMVAEKIYIKLEAHLSDSHMRDLSPSLNILARDTRANRPKFLLWRARVIPALASLNFLYLRHIKMHIFYVLFLFFSFFSLGYCPSLLIFIFN
jgi:hypothetical protein